MTAIHRLRAILTAALAVTATALAPATTAHASPAAPAVPAAPAASPAPAAPAAPAPFRDVCGAPAPGFARCFAEVRTDVHGGPGVRGAAARRPVDAAPPDGYGPADLRAAYRLPAIGGADQTVAVVDAGDDPTAEADLAVYRQTYGLPPCTTDNGCFRKVGQDGRSEPLPQDWGWALETSLDLDMVSAACPQCRILLVESDDPSISALATAVDTSVALGADEVSNSYGSPEATGVDAFRADYAHPGAAIVAASGDSGYTVPSLPAVYPSVIAVGGTSLTPSDDARGWHETAWNGAGSGCSAWLDKPAWQTDPHCPGRTVADVSAVADPRTSPAVYDTHDEDGWVRVGGTSAAAPFVAGVIALGGHPERFPDASYLYAHAGQLNDVVGGDNVDQNDCGGDYLCTAVPGYDGPTGNGSPNGLGAF